MAATPGGAGGRQHPASCVQAGEVRWAWGRPPVRQAVRLAKELAARRKREKEAASE